VERQGEFAVRVALGARRLDLFRLLFLQLALLTAPGLAVGFPIAIFILRKLSGLVPSPLAALIPPRLDSASLTISLASWLAVVLVSAAGVWLSAPQIGLISLLVPEQATPRRTRPQVRFRLALVCMALSLAVTLGAVTAVLRQSLANLQQEPLGFEPNNAVSGVIRFTEPLAPEELPGALARLGERIASIPGVAAVSFSDSIPFGSSVRHLEIRTPGRPELWLGRIQGIHGSFLRAMGLRVLAGREFAPLELDTGAPVAFLDQQGAREIFDGLPPVGKTLIVGERFVEVVGIVPSIKLSSPGEPRRPQVYLPLLSARTSLEALGVIARLSGPVDERAFNAAAASTGASASQYRFISEGLEVSLEARRLARDMAFFLWAAVLALVALATFGTISCLFELRSFEHAVRLALGDTEAGIAGRVFRSALWIVATAVLLGLGLYVPAGQALRALLFGVDMLSPVALLEAVAVVGGVALGAAALAARAALRSLSFDRLKAHGSTW
jgi:putative ABC transport system permease protein